MSKDLQLNSTEDARNKPVSVDISIIKASPHSDSFNSSMSATSWYWQLHRVGDDSIASIFSNATIHTENQNSFKLLQKEFEGVLEDLREKNSSIRIQTIYKIS